MRVNSKVRFLNFFRNVFRISILEAQLRKLTMGKSPDSLISKFVPNPYQYPSNALRRVELNGIRLQVNISDYIGHYLYFGFEDKSFDALFSLCKSDSYILDVGANIGWTVLSMARIATKGEVIGFEPDPYNFSECQRNISLNDLPNGRVLPIGLGAVTSTAMMEIRTPSNRGGNRISPETVKGSVAVLIDRLDNLKEIQSWPKLDLIKIDVEGYEMHVLEGAGSLLAKFKPVLFIELDDENLKDQGRSASSLISFLEQKGYESIRNAETGTLVSSNDDFTNCHFDIIVS